MGSFPAHALGKLSTVGETFMNYAVAPITSYARLREVVDAQMEADSCLPVGSIHLAREHGSVLLSSARLELEQMATHRRIFRDHF